MAQDRTGESFLTPIRLNHLKKDKTNRHFQYWLYKCKCGNTKVIAQKSVKSGNTRSCGCLREKIRQENLRKGRTKAKKFSKGHSINKGRKFINRKAPNKGRVVLYEYPGKPLSGRKKYITHDEMSNIWAGESSIEKYFPNT